MKKWVIALAALLAAALGGAGYWAAQSGLFDSLGQASQVDASAPSPSEAAKEETAPKAELGVKKELKTRADVMDALVHESTQNPDTVGWLSVPGTSINNSVVQSHDNYFYLRKNERKEENIYGCYFVDYACATGARDKLSPNTVIYGHSDLKDSPDGPRFSQLFKFTSEEFARAHPDIHYSTLESEMYWQIFAVLYTDTSWDYIDAEPDEAKMQSMLDFARRGSLYNYDVPVAPGDKILTLSTCAVKYGTTGRERFVVMAKLMPEGYKPQKTASLEINTQTTHP